MAADLLLFLPLGDGEMESKSTLLESELALLTSPIERGRSDFLRLWRLAQKKFSSSRFCPGLSEHALWEL